MAEKPRPLRVEFSGTFIADLRNVQAFKTRLQNGAWATVRYTPPRAGHDEMASGLMRLDVKAQIRMDHAISSGGIILGVYSGDPGTLYAEHALVWKCNCLCATDAGAFTDNMQVTIIPVTERYLTEQAVLRNQARVEGYNTRTSRLEMEAKQARYRERHFSTVDSIKHKVVWGSRGSYQRYYTDERVEEGRSWHYDLERKDDGEDAQAEPAEGQEEGAIPPVAGEGEPDLETGEEEPDLEPGQEPETK